MESLALGVQRCRHGDYAAGDAESASRAGRCQFRIACDMLPQAAPIGRGSSEAPPTWTLLLPALHRPFELGGGGFVGPHRLVVLALELDQVGRRLAVLAGLVEFDAAIAHHQLLGL